VEDTPGPGRYIAVQGVEEFDDERHFLFMAGEVNTEEIEWGVIEGRAFGNIFPMSRSQRWLSGRG